MLRGRPGSRVSQVALALFLMAVLALGPGNWPGRAVGAAGGSGWRVVGQRAIVLGGLTDQKGGIISLSPNGQWLAVLRYASDLGSHSDAICVYAVATLRQTHCGNLVRGLDPSTVVWSPDSSHLAFTEDIRYLVNCDIWVLDVATGTLHDLTPDGATSDFMDPHYKGPKALMDLSPAWSPDGKTLLFVRSIVGGHDTSLYRIPVSGGTPIRLAVIADQPFAFSHGLRWLSDGGILYSPSYSNPQDPRNGLWLLGARGGTPRQLLKPDPTSGPPLLVQVAADARTALVWYPEYTARVPNTSAYTVVDLAGGAAHPLGPPLGAPLPNLGPAFASLSPDGSWLFCLDYSNGSTPRQAIRSVRGGHEWPLRYQTATRSLGSRMSMQGIELDWVGDSTIYLGTGDMQGVLLTLRRD